MFFDRLDHHRDTEREVKLGLHPQSDFEFRRVELLLYGPEIWEMVLEKFLRSFSGANKRDLP